MEDKAQPSVLIYNGHEHRVGVILAQQATAPRFEVKVSELILPQHALAKEVSVELKGTIIEPKKGNVLVTKYKAGYVVLLGSVTDNLKNPQESDPTILVTLISNHALKRARVSEEAVVVASSSSPRPVPSSWSVGERHSNRSTIGDAVSQPQRRFTGRT